MVFDQFLTIIYVSENSHKFFRSPSTCLIGQPLSSIVYPEDLIEMSEILTNVISNSVREPKKLSCFCRLRFPFKRASGILNLMSGYRLYNIQGFINNMDGLVHSLWSPVFVDELIIRPIDNHTFVSLLDLDSMTILYQDQRAVRYHGYGLDEVKGQSAFRFLHHSFVNSKTLNASVFFEKGETMTEAYLSKTKTGWVWLRSSVTLYDSLQIEYRNSGVILIAITNVLGEEHEYTSSKCTNVGSYYEPSNELFPVDPQLGVYNISELEQLHQPVTQVFQSPSAVPIHGTIQQKEYSESMINRCLQYASHCVNQPIDFVLPPQMSPPTTPHFPTLQFPMLPNANIGSSRNNLMTTYESYQQQQNGFSPSLLSTYLQLDSPMEDRASCIHQKHSYRHNLVLPSDLLTTPDPISNHLQNSTFTPTMTPSYNTTNLIHFEHVQQYVNICPTYIQYDRGTNHKECNSIPRSPDHQKGRNSRIS